MVHLNSQMTAPTSVADKSCSRRSSSAPTSRQQTPQRRRDNTSRGARRSVYFPSVELDELVRTSEMVPVGGNKASDPPCKFSIDSEALSTAPPSSAESSPALSFIVGEGDAAKWPSLRESSSGWDFCSEHSDSEEPFDLPEPFVVVEDVEWVVNETTVSYADSVRGCNGPPRKACASPPVLGTRMVPMAMDSLKCPRPRRGSASNDDVDEDPDFEFQSTQWHGWTKQHKASWSKKQQRKVAEQIKLRTKQSWQSRGWAEPED